MDTRTQASQELLVFLDSYTELLARCIESVRAKMDETATDAMASITEIGDRTEHRARHANQILVARSRQDLKEDDRVRQGSDEHFKSIAAEQLESSGMTIMAGSSTFRGQLEKLGIVDSSVQTLLMNMVGLLSTDDVIGQKLSHVADGLRALKEGMVEIIQAGEGAWKQEYLNNTINGIKDKLFKSYTAEDEKVDYKKIFVS